MIAGSSKKKASIALERRRTTGTLRVALGAVVVMVRVEVELPPARVFVESGLSAQPGARGGLGCTEQVKATVPLKPPTEVTVIVAIDEPPTETDGGQSRRRHRK